MAVVCCVRSGRGGDVGQAVIVRQLDVGVVAFTGIQRTAPGLHTQIREAQHVP